MRTQTASPGWSGRPIATASTAARLPQLAAAEFLTEHARRRRRTPQWLSGAALTTGSEDVDLEDGGSADIELRFDGEKRQFDTTTVAYQQTWRGLPVWRCGVTVTMRTDPVRVANVHSTAHREIEVELPTRTDLKRGITGTRGLMRPAFDTTFTLRSARSSDNPKQVEVVSNRLVVHWYDAARRLTDETSPAPEIGVVEDAHDAVEFPFPIPAAPEIEHGTFRIAREIVFRIATPPRGVVTWMVLLDVATGALLWLRPFVADVTGLVFAKDPSDQGSGVGTNGTSAQLNPLRSSATLLGLTAPAAGAEQALTGNFINVSDFELADADPPTEPVGTNFDYDARTNDFAAVNAYVHNDAFFRLVDGMGFTGVLRGHRVPRARRPSRPLRHRHGIEINASCTGNGTGGIANVDYELADLGDTRPTRSAWPPTARVVLHELGGHGILYDHVNFANFGFAHSAGDSFAAILCDPDYAGRRPVPDVPVGVRRHQPPARPAGRGRLGLGRNRRTPAATAPSRSCPRRHFRIYRSLGGDSTSLDTRRFAARVTAYLILRAVSNAHPEHQPVQRDRPGSTRCSPPTRATGPAKGWPAAPTARSIRWAFEKQGLYQAPGAPTPGDARGRAAGAVDVYIDDGRHGEYQYQPVHWDCQNIWNRRFADDGTAHEDPWLEPHELRLHAGAQPRHADRDERGRPGVPHRSRRRPHLAGRLPADDDRRRSRCPTSPPGGEVIVGPFSGRRRNADHECLLMVASAIGRPEQRRRVRGRRVDPRVAAGSPRQQHRPAQRAPGAGRGRRRRDRGGPRRTCVHRAQPVRAPRADRPRRLVASGAGREGLVGRDLEQGRGSIQPPQRQVPGR